MDVLRLRESVSRGSFCAKPEAKDPPNATVSAFSKDGPAIRDAVVVLKTPKLEGDRLTFDVDVLEGELTGADGQPRSSLTSSALAGFMASLAPTLAAVPASMLPALATCAEALGIADQIEAWRVQGRRQSEQQRPALAMAHTESPCGFYVARIMARACRVTVRSPWLGTSRTYLAGGTNVCSLGHSRRATEAAVTSESDPERSSIARLTDH